jgi:tetratricopeptide (TPR) repeat protein
MSTKRHFASSLMMVAIVVLTFTAYRDTLNYFFTAPDSLTQIDTARIDSPSDLGRIFSKPLMNDTKAMRIVQHYRPVASLSYSIDYAIWRLNPFGYHLTDVMLQALVSLLTFVFLRRATGSLLVAAIGGVLFVLHPVHAENVYAVARRHDALAMLFIYMSWFLFMRHQKRPARWVWGLSLVAFAAALGSKEIAVVFPVLLATYLVVSARRDSVAASGDGVDGGVASAVSPGHNLMSVVRDHSWMSAVRQAMPYVVVTVVYVGWRTWVLGGIGGDQWADRAGYFEIVGLYVKGLLDPYRFVDSFLPVIAQVALWVIVALWVYWRFVRRDVGRGAVLSADRVARSLLFFAIWILLPLAILVVTRNFAIRRIYVGVVAACAILPIVLVDSIRFMIAAFRGRYPGAGGSTVLALNGIVVLVVALLCVGIIVDSPLARNYTGWRYVAGFSKVFLDRMNELVPQLPNDAKVHVQNLPVRFVKPTRRRAHIQSTRTALDYSVESWIDLHHPGNDIEITMHRRPALEIPPEDVKLDMRISQDGVVRLFVKPVLPAAPNKEFTARDLGIANIDIEQFDKAMKLLDEYTRREPEDPLGWAFLGKAHLELKQYKPAEQALERSLELNADDNSDAYVAMVRLLREQRRYTEAEDIVFEWLAQMPGDGAAARRNLGWVYVATRAFPKAIEQFEQSLRAEKSTHAYRGLLVSLVDGLGDYDRGRSYAQAWADFDRRSPEALFVLGFSLYNIGEIEPAIAVLERCLRLGQRGTGAPYRAFQVLGQARAAKGDLRGSIGVFQDGTVEYPDSADLYSRIAESYAKLGECKTARDWLGRAVDTGLAAPRRVEVRGVIRNCETNDR